MRWSPVSLPDGTYSDEDRPWTDQDVVNYIPTLAEQSGARSKVKYVTAPGLRTALTLVDGPHRAARDVEGRAFIVSGNRLYTVASDLTATDRGYIPGTGRLSITHNQVDGGNQVVIGTIDNSYVYDTRTETLTATGVGLQSVDFLGQYILGVEPKRRFWRYSALADATDYSSLDVESAESSPDRIMGGIVARGEWYVFGERTMEVFVNQPTGTTAFQRSTVRQRGCANAATLQRLAGTIFFVGDDLIPYRLDGYTPIPIASKAIVTSLAGSDPKRLFATTWEERGRLIYYITAQDGRTWGYDVTTDKWHRKESPGMDRWRLNTLFKWRNSWWGGDYSDGSLYQLEWGYCKERGANIRRRIRTGVMHSEGNRVFVHAAKVLANTGLPSADSVQSEWTPISDSGVPYSFSSNEVSGSISMSGSTITASAADQDSQGLPLFTLSVSQNIPVRVSIQSFTTGDIGSGNIYQPAEFQLGGQTIQVNEASPYPSGNWPPPTGPQTQWQPSSIEIPEYAGQSIDYFQTIQTGDLVSVPESFSMLIEVGVVNASEGRRLQLRYSNDGANNFSPWRDMGPGDTGAHITEMKARRLGFAYHRVWEIEDSSDAPQDILAFMVQAE